MEMMRTRERVGGGPGGPGGLPLGVGLAGDPVTIAAGCYCEQLPVGGMSVGEIRARYSDRFEIHPLSQAYVGGQPAGDETRVGCGQMLTFMHRAGEKGRGLGEPW